MSFLKSAMIKTVRKNGVGKYEVFRSEKFNFSIFKEESRILRQKSWFHFGKFRISGKVLNFSNVTFDALISHFCHVRTFGEKVILHKYLIFCQNLSSTFL